MDELLELLIVLKPVSHIAMIIAAATYGPQI